MKIFISWSGSQSKKLGESIRDWLPAVLQLVKPYFTPSDIEKGTRWSNEIAKELENSEFGILCITRENLHSDWVLFEAGALSKSLEKSHVCPILFGITNTDLSGPLKQFQTTEFSKKDFQKLLGLVNAKLGDSKLSNKTLDSVFEKWWPELEERIKEILSNNDPEDEPVRTERELIEEILSLSRITAKRSQQSTLISPKAVRDILKFVIVLHNKQEQGEGGYQDTLNDLKKMDKAISHIARRYIGHSDELDQLIETYSALSYTHVDNQSDDLEESPF